MNFEISKEENKNGNPKRYRLELSLTGAVGLGTVLVLGLVWVFIFGVLVGRGYQPEKAVPELARIMPEEQKTKKGGQQVIQPEELTFLDTLRDEPKHGQPMRPSEMKKQEAAEVVEVAEVSEVADIADVRQETAAAPRPVAEQKTQQQAPALKVAARPEPAAQPEAKPAASGEKPEAGVQSVSQQQAPATQQAATPAEDEEVDQTRYDYVYQIASLSEPKSALQFRDKVRKLGLHSEVKVIRGDEKYWHRVVVQFQGRPIDTREMKAKLKTLGVDKPLLRSKVPAS